MLFVWVVFFFRNGNWLVGSVGEESEGFMIKECFLEEVLC